MSPIRIEGVMLGSTILFFLGFGPLVPSPPMPLTITPYSLPLVIPAFILGPLGVLLMSFVMALGFFLIGKHLLKTGRIFPKGLLVAFAILTVLSIVWAGFGWDKTVKFTSIYRAIALAIQSVAPPVVLWSIILLRQHKMTINQSIIFHWCAMAWLEWSAFPWWGELL